MEAASDRLLWEGRLFSDEAEHIRDEEELLADPDATYELCPATLLLALMARAARSLVRRKSRDVDRWIDGYMVWDGLAWSEPLTWHNLQDPLVRPALHAAMLMWKVLLSMVERPADVCKRYADSVSWHMGDVVGFSLTVSQDKAENMNTYPAISQTSAVFASYDELLQGEIDCLGARLLSHAFTGRRLVDLRRSSGLGYLKRLENLETHHSEELRVGGHVWLAALGRLNAGLRVQWHWLEASGWFDGPRGERPPIPNPPGSTALWPLSIWEPNMAPTFSEGMKDPILERLFGVLGTSPSRYFVEIGTQSGEQCNTRYLRVRFGFRGLMIDDNFQNAEVNQQRHFVTPSNVAGVFQKYDVPRDFDLLSLDTDGNEWLLWLSLLRDGYRPRMVIVEFNNVMPFDADVLVRHTAFPVHRLCLSAEHRLPTLPGGSVRGIMSLGNAYGYSLVHMVVGGTTDLLFVRADVLEGKNVAFPAQDDPAGLCALAAHQTGLDTGKACSASWATPAGKAPPDDLLASSAQVLAGDWALPGGHTPEHLRKLFC